MSICLYAILKAEIWYRPKVRRAPKLATIDRPNEKHLPAVDANNYGVGWGYNNFGQCGNTENDNNKLTRSISFGAMFLTITTGN
jgi:hypothetical protein